MNIEAVAAVYRWLYHKFALMAKTQAQRSLFRYLMHVIIVVQPAYPAAYRFRMSDTRKPVFTKTLVSCTVHHIKIVYIWYQLGKIYICRYESGFYDLLS